MKIKTQLRIILAVFTIALLVISLAVLINTYQIQRARTARIYAINIAQAANQLTYFTNDYVLFEQNQQLRRWQTVYDSISNNLRNLTVNNSEQQMIVEIMQDNHQRISDVFDNTILFLDNLSENSNLTLSDFQVLWSSMNIPTQELAASATNLSRLLNDDVEQLNFIT